MDKIGMTPTAQKHEGRDLALSGIAPRDSERMEAEAALRRSEEHYRSLVENIKDAYYVSDVDGKLTYASPNLSYMSGYSLEELIDQRYGKLIAHEDRRRVVAHYLRCAADGTGDTTCTFRARARDGREAWIEQATRLLRDEQGRVVEYRNLVRVVTALRLAADCLSRAEPDPAVHGRARAAARAGANGLGHRARHQQHVIADRRLQRIVAGHRLDPQRARAPVPDCDSDCGHRYCASGCAHARVLPKPTGNTEADLDCSQRIGATGGPG